MTNMTMAETFNIYFSKICYQRTDREKVRELKHQNILSNI